MNLELDLQFGPGKCLNLGTDHQFRSSSGSYRFEPVKFLTQFSTQKASATCHFTSLLFDLLPSFGRD
jgi:hypothetical protein